MRWCKKLAETLLVVTLAVASVSALAAEIEIRNTQLVPEEAGQALSADFVIDFGPRLEEAVGKGLVLHFVAEFELKRPRWYWFDEKVVRIQQTWRLNYHALTQKYRLSNGALHLTFSTLSEALHILSRLRGWLVIERDLAAPGETFEAALRMRLDTSQLPKPFQVEALSNRDWVLSSDWKRWPFTMPAPVPPPVPASVPVLPPVPVVSGGDSK